MKTFAVSNKEQENLKDEQRDRMTEVSLSKHLSSKIKTRHEIVRTNDSYTEMELKDASKNCFDGCLDFGVVNYSMVSKYKSKKGKVIMFVRRTRRATRRIPSRYRITKN